MSMNRDEPKVAPLPISPSHWVAGVVLALGQMCLTTIHAYASLFLGFAPEYDESDASASYPARAEVVTSEVLFEHSGVKATGGYSSSLAIDPTEPNHFYLLCDRGPNVHTTEENHLVFLVPSFAPRIGRFRWDGHSFQQESVIELKGEHGRPLSGLPRKPGEGGTGEVAQDLAGNVLDYDSKGIDPEGLVALPDGSFWVSEEYGPSLLRVDHTGRTLERIDPYGPVGRSLPRVFRHRWPNRGIEGLTITPDGATLVGTLESPLDNPTKEFRKKSRVVRLFTFEITTGKTHQFVYIQDEPGVGNSDIAALSDTSFVVIERDKKRPGDEKEPSRVKRVYRIDIHKATDVSDPADGPEGRLVDGKTLEQLGEEELRVAGIRPVTKTLVVDLLKLPGGYPHDKPEGLAVIGDRLLAISNDDDFGVDDDGKGTVVAKTLPGADNAVDRTQIYFINLDQPLQ